MRAATGLETHWAQSLEEAVTRLREQTYSAAIIDQLLLETDPAKSDRNDRTSGHRFSRSLEWNVWCARCAPPCTAAKREENAARRAVEDQMRSYMRGTLAAMLLSRELAVSVPDVPDRAVEKIRAIDNFARELHLRQQAN